MMVDDSLNKNGTDFKPFDTSPLTSRERLGMGSGEAAASGPTTANSS
jgi:hypothetical protein